MISMHDRHGEPQDVARDCKAIQQTLGIQTCMNHMMHA
jgi:hypothetical protein